MAPRQQRRDAVVLDLNRLSGKDLREFSNAEFEALAGQTFQAWQQDRKEMALLHYVPASEQSERIHLSDVRVRAIFAGNGAGKTETSLVECAMLCTGIVPEYLRRKHPDYDWRRKLRGPIQARVVCESIINVLTPIMLPKLRWNHWTGVDEPGGERGHWGWIPKFCLIDGSWERSWSEKTRLLRVLYRNPENIDEVVGESTIQFMSYDVHPSDFASGDLHFVLLDEPPTLPIYTENEARTMRVRGKIMLAMTWPDDPAINVDWIHDEIYERGVPGPKKRPDIECFEFHTTQNRHLDQDSIRVQMESWDERKRSVRIFGRQIRFSNRVHGDFTDVERTWCFACGEDRLCLEGVCVDCGSRDTTTYCHVQDFAWNPRWPVIHVIDPHPRKPHMSTYEGITPDDDWWQIAELECKGDPAAMRDEAFDLEASLGLQVVRRIIDPRMGGSPSGVNRERTWSDEFDAVGLYCDPGDPSDVGRTLVDQMLRPDPNTRKPRMLIHERCSNSIYQMKRFMWDDWRIGTDKSQKQKVKDKYDDYPACKRYLANEEPTFRGLIGSGHGSLQFGARSFARR